MHVTGFSCFQTAFYKIPDEENILVQTIWIERSALNSLISAQVDGVY
jgi:hypothetical protein